MDAVLPTTRSRPRVLTGVLGIAHLALTLLMLALIRHGGAGSSGEADRPALDVLLGGIFHALTVPVLLVRLLLAPLLRHALLDAALLALNSLLYAALLSRLVRWFLARRRRGP